MPQVSEQAIFTSPGNIHPRSYAPWVVICLLLIGPLPILIKLANFLWDREQYQFFPLMIAGAGLLAWERWQDLPSKKRLASGSLRVAIGLLLTALLLLITSALFWVQAAAGLATIFILAAIAWRAGGPRLLRVISPSMVLLLTILPPPGGRDQRITLGLQQMAVSVSSRMLDALHVPHVQTGSVLEIPGRRLLVEQACSGINSLMAVLAFSLLYGFWRQRPFWWIILLLPAAGFFVFWGNIVRITGEAWLKVSCNIDWLEGAKHELMGLGLFIGCVGLVLSFDALIECSVGFSKAKKTEGEKFVDPPNRVRKQPSISFFEWMMCFIFVLSAIAIEARVRNAWSKPNIKDRAQFDLPARLSGWDIIKRTATLVERPQTQAAISYIWQFHRQNLIASVAIDYPFTGYHQLSGCYKGAGWNVISEDSATNAAQLEFQQVVMSKVPDQHGYLLFNLTNEFGKTAKFFSDLPSVNNSLAAYRNSALGGPTFQVQVFAQKYSQLSQEERDETEKLFIEARRSLISQVQSQLNKP